MNASWPSWLKQIVGPAPNLKEINLICWVLFVVCLLIPLCIFGVLHPQVPDADFGGFYGVGRLLNEHPGRDLYDYGLQERVFHQIYQQQEIMHGPLPYPPFVGVFFRPFAHLSYPAAYLLWAAISLALYVAGFAILSARLFPGEPLLRSLSLLPALLFYPFLAETVFNGQLSAIAFIAMAIAVSEDDLGHGFRSGLALSVCLYKPTLLLVLLPMLIVSRRVLTLLGFAAGAAAGVIFVTAIEGFGIWPAYLHGQLSFARQSIGIQTHSFLRLEKFVDLTSFSALMHGGRSWPVLALLFGCACWAGMSLLRVWWKSPSAGQPFSRLMWAATLTWTLLLNIYMPMYDTILVVLGVLLTARVMRDLANSTLRRWFTLLCVLIFAGSWIAVKIAQAVNLQIMTVLIAALGTLQLFMLRGFKEPRAGLLEADWKQEAVTQRTVTGNSIASRSPCASDSIGA